MSSNARITQQYVEAAGTPDSRNARITQQYVEVAVQLLPAVTTAGVDNSGSTAILAGSWSRAANSTISELDAYFEYRETGAGSWSQTTTQEDIAAGGFYAELTGLTEGTEYEYRAVIAFGGETVYGATESFTAKIVFESGFNTGILADVFIVNGLTIGGKPEWQADDKKTAFDSSNASVAVDAPDNLVVGDLILIFISGRMQASITPPTGFTLLRYEGDTGSSFRPFVAVYYKVATAGEPSRYTFTFGTAANEKRLTSGRVSGGNVIDQNNGANSGSVSANNIVIPEITTTGKSILFAFAGIRTSTTVTVDTGMTEIFKNESDGYATAGAAIEERTTIGATGTRTFNFGASNRRAGMMFNVLFPSGSGTRTKPHALSGTFPANTVSWTATTPADTSVTVHAQVQEPSAVTDEAVGTGDGDTTEFYLDHWPTGAPTVKVDAVAETGFTQDLLDPRKITFDAAPADTLAITASYTAVDDPVELDWEAQTSGNALTVPTQGTNVTGKYLWIKQTLATTDPEVTPTLTLFEVEADSEPDTALSVNVVTAVSVTEETSFSCSDQEVSIFDTCSVEEWLALAVSEPAAVPAVSISSAEEVGVAEWIGVLLSDLAVSVGEDVSVSEDVGVLAEEAAGLEVSVYEECSLVELSTIEYSVATHFRYWRLALFGANSVYYTEGSFSTSGFVLANIELRSSKGGTNEVGSGTASAIGTTTSTAENAFDGDPDTTWLANIAQNGWIQYDFGSGNAVQIEEVVLTAGKGTNEEWCCPACFILYYWDGSDWIPKHTWLYEVEGWLSGETKVFNDASSGYAPLSSGGKKRYWRIWATNSSWVQQQCAILRMREEKNGGDRMGSGTPSAVSEHASNPPSNFTDENTVTYWIADTYYYHQGANCPWYGYDFGEGNSFEIGEWTFTTDSSTGGNRGPRNNYIVVCSDDGADWEVAWANQDYTGMSSWSEEQTKTFTNPNCPELTHPDISCFSSVTLLEEVGCAISVPGAGIELNVEVMESVAVIDGVVFFFAELVISAATEVSLTETLLLGSDYFVAVDTTVSVSEFPTVEGGHVLCSVVDTVSVTEAPWPAVSDLLAVVSEDVVLSEEAGTNRFALFFSLSEGVSVAEDVSLVVFPADALVEVSDDCGLSEDVELSLVSIVDVAVSEAVGVAEGVEGVVPFLPLSVQDGTFIQEGVGSESNLLGVAFDSVTVAEDILVVTDSCRVEVSEVVACTEGDGVVLSSSQIELFEGVGLAEVVVVEVQEAEARLITCWEDVAVTEDVGLGGSELNAFALTDVTVREYAYPYWVIAHGQLLMFAETEIPEVLIVTSVIDIEIDCLIPEIEVEVA